MARPHARVPGLRTDQCAQVISLFDKGHRLVTITGLGGVGKSSLALDVIERFRIENPEINCTVLEVSPVEGVSIRERLLDELADPGVAAEAPQPSTAQVAEPRLVVIDGGEHLLRDAADLPELIDATPGLRLLVTSRVALGVPSEATVALRGLDTTADGDGVKLFLALADEQSVKIVPDDRPYVRKIVDQLGGYPLAIRLCAVRLQKLSLSALHDLVIERRSQHEGTEATDPLLREVIEWSLDRQTAQAVGLLKLLAAFNGWGTLDSIEGIAVEAARSSAGPTRRTAGMTLWLAELIDAGLVDAEEAPALGESTRLYRVSDSVREVVMAYGATDESPPSQVRDAHRAWFRSKAAELAAAAATRRESSAFEQLQAEFSEYSIVLDELVDTDPMAVLQIVNQIGEFWITRGRLRAGIQLMRRALRQLGEDDGLGTGGPNTVLAQSWLAQMKLRSGAWVATTDYQQWLSERLRPVLDATVEPDREHFALAVHFMYVAMVNKEYDEGLQIGARCRDLAVDAGDDHHSGVFCFYLARLSDQAGDSTSASDHIERAIVHVRRTRNESFLAKCVSQAVLLEQDQLSPAELVEKLKPLPEIHLRNRSFKDAALISIPLAIAHSQAGEQAEALALLRRTLALSHRIHFFDGQLYAVVLIAFSELSEDTTPENLNRCARLYGSIRPYLKRFYAITAPNYQQMLEGGIQGLGFMLGQAALDRITAQSPTSWSKVMAEADTFAAEQQQAMTGTVTGAEPNAQERISSTMELLNDRERELLDLVLTGITDKQIADRMSLKPNTVRSYNSRIFRKFNIASRTELLALFRTSDR